MKVNWTHPDEVHHKGLIKCKVIAPKGLYLPVLPVRIPDDQRLVIPLCEKRAKRFKTEQTVCFEEYSCPIGRASSGRPGSVRFAHDTDKHSIQRMPCEKDRWSVS